jgi:group I intron endonuclease
MKISGIYAITQITTGISYIGSSTNVSRRWKRHKSDLDCGRHHAPWLQRAWSKHGAADFNFKLIETVEPPNSLRDRERAILSKTERSFNTMQAPDREGVMIHGEQTRRKMSEAQIARFKKNPKGPITDEQKAQISETHKDRKATDEARAKMSTSAKLRTNIDTMREMGKKANASRTYRPLSDEQKHKLSIAHYGNKLSEDHKSKIRQGMVTAHATGRHKNGFQPKSVQSEVAP